jgi:ABC-type Fe3+-citrate transport system substrate-binding protein
MNQYTVNDMMKAYSEDALDLGKLMDKELDFSEESLKTLEEILDRYHKELPKGLKRIFFGPSKDKINQISKIWGAYLGEVIIKHLGGEWKMREGLKNAIALCFDNGIEIYPPAKVNKRLLNGFEDNIWAYYQILKKG